MKTLFKILIAMMCLFFVGNRVWIFTTYDQIALGLSAGMFFLLFVILIILFLLLLYFMKNYHAYEYDQNKKALW
jgi:hypothetical protein